MNGARSTFKRKGYLLTALAAAVLLAASPGIASAQNPTVGFSAGSVTVSEGASSAGDTPAPAFVNIVISGLTAPNPDATPAVAGNLTDGLGTLQIRHTADPDNTTGPNRRVWIIEEGSTALQLTGTNAQTDNDDGMDDGKIGVPNSENGFTLNYKGNGIIRLAMINPSGDNNWKDDEFTVTLTAQAGTNINQATTKVTITDVSAQPVVKFTPASIKLTERSQTTATLHVAAGDDKAIPSDVSALTGTLRLAVSDSKMIAVGLTCNAARDANATDADKARARPIHISGTGAPAAGVDTMGMTKDTFVATGADIGTLTGTAGVPFTIEACDETMDFRNVMAMLTPVVSSLVSPPDTGPGSVGAGQGLTIHVESDEEVPEVSFATTAVSVDESDSTSVFIVADTMQGDEVGMADVMVEGYARISLFGDNVTANGDGAYSVAFGSSANTRLHIRANGDESLNDGETKTATITITGANGADIGEDNMVTVTVNGSTSVPALPLIAQLLLALFLMAGGQRLYRRRQS